MNFKNYMEDVVVSVYQEFLNSNPDYCRCDLCRADVIALALRQLRGLYAVTDEGEIFVKVSCEDRQIRADVLVVIIDSARKVAQNPRH